MFGFPSGDLNVFWWIKDSIYNMPVRFELPLVYMLLQTALGD